MPHALPLRQWADQLIFQKKTGKARPRPIPPSESTGKPPPEVGLGFLRNVQLRRFASWEGKTPINSPGDTFGTGEKSWGCSEIWGEIVLLFSFFVLWHFMKGNAPMLVKFFQD